MASGTDVTAPYGFLPINLIGGQVFAGSTRMYPIQYGYATDIFYGDFVKVVRGSLTRVSIESTTDSNALRRFLGLFVHGPRVQGQAFFAVLACFYAGWRCGGVCL